MSPEPPRRRGRRDNGLHAALFVPLADVDPRVGEHLLVVLWAAGVPAYLEPTADIEPTRALSLPSPPTDRLWVDRDRRTEARTIVEAEAPTAPFDPRARASQPMSAGVGGEPADPPSSLRAEEQQAWQALVRGLTLDSPPAPDFVAPWPAAEDIDADPAADSVPPGFPAPAAIDTGERSRGPRDSDASLLDDPPDALASDDDDEHYVPPPPPPIPRPSKEALGALLVLAAGALLLVAPSVLGIDTRTGFILGVIGIVTGVGLLVWRIRADRPDDDADDDGAVV